MSSPSGVRKPNASTSDLLSWSETPPPPLASSSAVKASGSAPRSHQPSDGISNALSWGQISQEAEALNRRKRRSDYKPNEITGNKIFGGKSPQDSKRTSVRIVQQAMKGMSQISFSSEEKVSTKKPVSLPKAAKQRELSGTLNNELNMKVPKPLSHAKCKELSGNDIFAPLPELHLQTRESRANNQLDKPSPPPPSSWSVRTSIKVSNPTGGQSNNMFGEEAKTKYTKKIHNQKFAELTGNDIFKGDLAHGFAKKPVSSAKQREMSGNDIFADGKVRSIDHLGGVRKPPGGETSIALI